MANQFQTQWPGNDSHLEAKTITKMSNFFWPLGLKLDLKLIMLWPFKG